MKQDVEDGKLWKSLKSGNLNALEKVFKSHYAYLHNYGLKMVNNVDLVEDCLQDLFLHIYENRKNLGEVKYIRSYLFTAFRRNLLYRIKQYNNKIVASDDVELRFTPEETGLTDREVFRNEVLSDMLNSLSPRQKELIYLRYYQEMSVQEISKTISVAPRGITNMLYKAMLKLKSDKISLLKLEKLITLAILIVFGNF
ncbi:RNA polymerase sigma factor [Membranihabitans maritimus]|uniref:RNA polymerase sigma factor n=1 Tax=Membranihabitans maritimus TaxID=2904244 RepID=UPI001F23CB48|nr:sigma-70 family RNA polymerase sigma factor [Membranihabitans maritimus]